jgi:SAM-dependent methyltransferase
MNALDEFKAAQRASWAHFAPLQMQTMGPAARLVRWARITPGQQLLDVACGTGVVALTAARQGATVTALDLTPELLQVARRNAELTGLTVDWHEGDAENLPFDAGRFDVVVSQYGHMFAPRPDVAAKEMLRVLKPGGTLAFSTWPPELMVGRLFALTGRYGPPAPQGVVPPGMWGDPAVVRERLGDAVRDIIFTRATMNVPALSPAHYREMFEKSAGPVIRIVETLGGSDPARLEQFRREVEALVSEYFEDNVVRQGYLMTRATKQ